MIPREILKKIHQTEIRTNRVVQSAFLLCLALVLSGVFVGCASRPDLYLAKIKQRQIDGSFANADIIYFVSRQWPNDPKVTAFYHDALATRFEEVILDLFIAAPGIWDDSFIEPIIQAMETNAPNVALVYESGAPRRVSWIAINNALAVLDRHHSVWTKDASIPPRLSAVVLTIFPSLTSASLAGPRPGDQMWCNAVNMLAQTHDSEMLAVLRPYLKDKGLAGDGSYWRGDGDTLERAFTPGRACDRAAIAIKQLLGERDSVDEPTATPGIVFREVRDTYPKWDEWDSKIGELQKRLDALERSKTNDPTSP